MSESSDVVKATILIIALVTIALLNLVLLLKWLGIGIPLIDKLKEISKPIVSLYENFSQALNLVKKMNSFVPGSGELVLFLILILVLAIPAELLMLIRRRR